MSRSAARLATLVAVPVALLAGLGAFAALGGFHDESGGATAGDGPTPAPGTARPPATGTVPLTVRPLPGRAETVCRALLSQLPGAVRDSGQRPVGAGAEQNAAYGDPPITVECGVPAASFPATDTVYSLNRVCWHAASAGGSTVWTTVDREVPVRVTVPSGYDEPGQWVIEFSGPVIAAVPSAKDIPAGCNP